LETHVAIIILCEAIAIVLCVWGLLHEEKLIRIERAFFGAVLWTLWERRNEKKTKNDRTV